MMTPVVVEDRREYKQGDLFFMVEAEYKYEEYQEKTGVCFVSYGEGGQRINVFTHVSCYGFFTPESKFEQWEISSLDDWICCSNVSVLNLSSDTFLWWTQYFHSLMYNHSPTPSLLMSHYKDFEQVAWRFCERLKCKWNVLCGGRRQPYYHSTYRSQSCTHTVTSPSPRGCLFCSTGMDTSMLVTDVQPVDCHSEEDMLRWILFQLIRKISPMKSDYRDYVESFLMTNTTTPRPAILERWIAFRSIMNKSQQEQQQQPTQGETEDW